MRPKNINNFLPFCTPPRPKKKKRKEKPNNTNLPSVNIFLKFIHNTSSWSKGSRLSLLCSWKIFSVHRNTLSKRESFLQTRKLYLFALLTLVFLKDFLMTEQFSPYELEVVPGHFGPVHSKIKKVSWNVKSLPFKMLTFFQTCLFQMWLKKSEHTNGSTLKKDTSTP